MFGVLSYLYRTGAPILITNKLKKLTSWHNEAAVKATFSVHKLIPKNAQMTTLYTNWSLYITFTMIYYIRQE